MESLIKLFEISCYARDEIISIIFIKFLFCFVLVSRENNFLLISVDLTATTWESNSSKGQRAIEIKLEAKAERGTTPKRIQITSHALLKAEKPQIE